MNFDHQIFWDTYASRNYTYLIEKNIHNECGIDMSNPDYCPIVHAREQDWEGFITPPVDTMFSMEICQLESETMGL